MNQIKIGADIELGFKIKPGNCINVPYYALRGQGRQIGTDHHGDVVELRPRVANTPNQLVNNIRNLLKHISKQNYKLISAPYIEVDHSDYGTSKRGCPVGGHIHLSWSDKNIRYGSRHVSYCYCWQCMKLNPNNENSHIQFDSRVTFQYLDMLSSIIEDPYLAKRRRSSGYGGKYSFRDVSETHIEYRRLPSFLFDPFCTRGILSFAYAVLQYELNLAQSDSVSLKQLKRETKEKTSPGNQSKYKQYLKDMAEKLPWFSKHKGDASALKHLLNRKLPLPTKRNILINWGLTK